MNRLGLTTTLFIVCSWMVLTGCNLSSVRTTPPKMDVTQAYQTVEAKLIQSMLTQTAQPLLTQDNLTQTPAMSATKTETPITSFSPPPPTLLPLPTSTPVCDRAAAGNPIDISIPDGTQLQPGQSFTKSWQLLNSGTCAWTTSYAIRFFYGELMSAPELLYLERDVRPGDQMIISVDLIAPTGPGTYQGNWKIQNATGQLFGMGPNGDAPFWVRIEVFEIYTPTPTPSQTPSATPSSTPSPTTTITPVVKVRQTVTLVPDDQLDLSNAVVNSTISDLAYIKDSSNFHQLVPQSPAIMGIYDSSEPVLAACKTTNMSAAPIALESLSSGVYLCYQTQQGLSGWLRFVQFDESAESVTLDLLTWAVP
jgi:hypothetical protein